MHSCLPSLLPTTDCLFQRPLPPKYLPPSSKERGRGDHGTLGSAMASSIPQLGTLLYLYQPHLPTG